MEANELRIGNCILFGEICKVSEIQKNCFYVENKDGVEFKSTNCEFQPIPLTEEILLKCGYFKLDNGQIHFVVKGHEIWLCNNLLMCNKNGVIIKYLHQLQNLYFALTGTELEIKL